jgi:phasin family protein
MADINTQFAEGMMRGNAEILGQASGIALNGFEKLAHLYLDTTKEMMSHGTAAMRALTSSASPQEFFSAQTRCVEPMIKVMSTCANATGDVVNKTATAYSDMAQTQIAQASERLHGAVDEFAKHAPDSALGSVALLKTAMKTADSSYEVANQAARKTLPALGSSVNGIRPASSV